MPSGAHALSALGPQTEKVVHRLLQEQGTFNLFAQVDEADLKKLADALHRGWTDEQAAQVVAEYEKVTVAGRRLNISALTRWVLSHPNDANAVIDCMSVDPPEEISIIRVLSRAGSQKLVFLATWKLTQRQVVLKRLIGSPEVQRVKVTRESRSHPLSMAHPNIIETHYLKNFSGEIFLVEERLPFLLSDDWRSHGIHDAANLLYDISNALAYIHRLNLVHGDVKPDNIGKRGADYILLDFGICRPVDDFSVESTPTGSLRTRAPELFETDHYELPQKVDVWAIGATIFNAVVGRFPFFDQGEAPPRISHPEERTNFEQIVKSRIQNEWNERVDLTHVPPLLRSVLNRALVRDPKERGSANEISNLAERELAVFLRRQSQVGRFSPLEEINQITSFLPSVEILKLMPETEREALLGRLQELSATPGLNVNEKEKITTLFNHMNSYA
jgi:serine/threonine protein kinase